MKKTSSCIFTLILLAIFMTLICLVKGEFITIPFISSELAFTLLVIAFTICAMLFCILLYNVSTLGNDIVNIDVKSNNTTILVSIMKLKNFGRRKKTIFYFNNMEDVIKFLKPYPYNTSIKYNGSYCIKEDLRAFSTKQLKNNPQSK